MEADERVNTLFESAVLHLRRGLEQLCQSFVSARGKNRDALIDRAIHNILTDTMRQKLLLEERGGGGQ
jgi:hypothetical protein